MSCPDFANTSTIPISQTESCGLCLKNQYCKLPTKRSSNNNGRTTYYPARADIEYNAGYESIHATPMPPSKNK